ncbi:MAG TPA: hypothetical protein VML55_08155 [Planctomycetaceae bacterium]|nr:hypothetical protein [Planctomycetaceae bacterium]
MTTLAAPPLYDELVDLLAEAADADRLLAFRLSAARQQQLDEFLEKNREGTLSTEELAELSSFERFEHIVRLLKARALARQPRE